MTKIPLILSTLTLTVAGNGALASPVTGLGENMAINVLSGMDDMDDMGPPSLEATFDWPEVVEIALRAILDNVDQRIWILEKYKETRVVEEVFELEKKINGVREELAGLEGVETVEALMVSMEERLFAIKQESFPWLIPPVTEEEDDEDEEEKKENGEDEGEEGQGEGQEGGGDGGEGQEGEGGLGQEGAEGGDDKNQNGTGGGTGVGNKENATGAGAGNPKEDSADKGDSTEKEDAAGKEEKLPEVEAKEPATQPAANGNSQIPKTEPESFGEAGADDSANESDEQLITSTTTETEDTVEIPNLGGEEKSRGWPWVILALSLAGSVGWWLWRAFGRKTQQK